MDKASWKPNFERVMTALSCQGEPDRVPVSEFSVDPKVMEAFMGHPVRTMGDRIKFWAQAGYDYVVIPVGIFIDTEPVDGFFKEGMGKYSLYGEEESKRQWVREGQGIILTERDLEKIPSIDPDRLDLSRFDEAAQLLPTGMKVMVFLGEIYAKTTQFFGLENFFYAVKQNPALVEAVIERIATVQLEVLKRVVEFDCVGGVWHPDDLAYNQGLFIAPQYYRKWIFPWYRRMNEICRNHGKGVVFHCDGDPLEVLEDIVDCGFMGLHPIQPDVMDIRALKRRYGRNICLIGNLDMDSLMSRGTPEMIRTEVKNLIRDVAPGGGYMAGSGNSISDFVPLENFKALLDTVFEFGTYPIRL